MNFSVLEARIAEATQNDDRRHSQRVPVEMGARVRPLGQEGCEARLVNLSDTGFMAETSADFEVGARVWLILPGRERAIAVVRWTAGRRMGAEFAAPTQLAPVRG